MPIRAGSDIAFLGGIVRYILENERYFKEYVVNYTNAAAIIDEKLSKMLKIATASSAAGTPTAAKYDIHSWSYKDIDPQPASGARESETAGKTSTPPRRPIRAEHTDPTLQDPHCVFQILRRHFRRYTPEIVHETCGIEPELFNKVAETLCRNSGRERTSAFCYAVGWTQHSVGVQYIRTAAIVQLLLGNMGRPGGGIMALQGHASIQGSTDIPTLYDLLPGYLPMPLDRAQRHFQTYCDLNRSPSGWWGEFDKYIVSLLKAWYGEAASLARTMAGASITFPN